MRMLFPNILLLLQHEAMPDWRTRRFWFDTRSHMLAPGFLVGLTFAFYAAFLMVLFAQILFFVSGITGGEAVQRFAFFLDSSAGDAWVGGSKLIAFIAFIFITENIVRVVLDTAVAKPFNAENSRRFFRAGMAGIALAVLNIVGIFIGDAVGGSTSIWSRGGFYLSAVMAVAFISLASAFKEGARLRNEQDLTV